MQAEVDLHTFATGTSAYYRDDNWAQIAKLCKGQGLDLPEKLVQGTKMGAHGAANQLLEFFYKNFTGKK